VEFDFDLGADTAMSVASEMVEDLSLSHEDAQVSLASCAYSCINIAYVAPRAAALRVTVRKGELRVPERFQLITALEQ